MQYYNFVLLKEENSDKFKKSKIIKQKSHTS